MGDKENAKEKKKVEKNKKLECSLSVNMDMW